MKKIFVVMLLILMLSAQAYAEEKIVSHTFTEPGQHNVTLTATDQYGASASKSVTIDARGNTGPSITLVAKPTSGVCPFTVTFTADITDPEGDQVTDFKWEVNGQEI